MNKADLPGIINYVKKPKYMRIFIDMNEDIDRDVLRLALDRTMPRYPYFSFRIVKTKTGYDKVENSLPVAILDKEAPLGSKEANHHWIEIILDGTNRLTFFTSHSTADGRGFTRFIKTLIYEYVSEKYGITPDSAGIILPDTAFLPGEDEKVSGSLPDADPLGRIKVKDPFVIPEGEENPIDYFRYELTFPEKEFLSFGKGSDASPLAMVSVIAAKMLRRLFPENEKGIYASIAADYRKALGCVNSRFNNSYMFYIKHDPKIADYDFEKLGTMTRGMIMLQSDDCNFRFVHNEMERINALLAVATDPDERHALRQQIADLFMARATYFVSYVGNPEWGSLAPYIKGAFGDVMAGKLMIEIMSAGGNFCVNWAQAFEDKKYIKTFADILEQNGISCTIKGPFADHWGECTLPQE